MTAIMITTALSFAGGHNSLAAQQSASVRLRGLDGSTVNTEDMRGKILVLAFGGTWVPLASKELPALQKIADRYTPRGVQFFWVSINSDKSGARNSASDAELGEFASKNGLRMKVLRDPEMNAYRSLGLDAVPTLVLIDQEGKVIRRHVGLSLDQPGSYNAVLRDIDQLIR